MTNEIKPLISVIMPTFNRQETIAYAIESILNQTYVNFELILVDDNSDDFTSTIMEFYKKIDKRIRIAKNETNSRNSLIEWEPRNDGLKLAKGELIAYLDSDNLWHSDFLESCYKPFTVNDNVRVVHCNTKNHYKNIEQYKLVIENDIRNLIYKNDDELTTVYSYTALKENFGGLSWYIDTNEMMHRASVFKDIGFLWATFHPNRKAINDSQLVKCTYRRHNDQELVERIISNYGYDSIIKIDKTLVDFFYSSSQRLHLTLKFEKEILSILNRKRSSNWVIKNSEQLSLETFDFNYLDNNEELNPQICDLGVGELFGPFRQKIAESFKMYAKRKQSITLLTKYGGTRFLKPAFKTLIDNYKSRGLSNIDEYSITPHDGGHNALFHTLQAIAILSSKNRKSKIFFMVPSYKYWTICAVSGFEYEALEAHDFESFVSILIENVDETTAAVIINTPHNPLGISIGIGNVEQLNVLAKKYNFFIIVDIPYHTFSRIALPLQIINESDEDLTIYCDSVSKSLALPGLRLGFTISKNHKLNCIIRACKSASSLLPSGLKVDFVDFLLKQDPHYIAAITTLVDKKRTEAKLFFENNALPNGISWKMTENSTFYDLLYIDKSSDLFHIYDELLVKQLLEKHNIIVSAETSLFPPLYYRKIKSFRILRLSYGKIDDVHSALTRLFNALKSLTS